jgi:hypothetical protein
VGMRRIVFKSCKLIVVMAGSTLIAGKVYSLFEYLVALSLVLGMISFSFADMRGGVGVLDSGNAMLIFGIMVLLLALGCDSVLGNLQEKVQKARLCDETSLMFVQSVVSSLLLLVLTLASGELREGVMQCWQDPHVAFALLAWAVSNMAGMRGCLLYAGVPAAASPLAPAPPRAAILCPPASCLPLAAALLQGVSEALTQPACARARGGGGHRHRGDAAGGW